MSAGIRFCVLISIIELAVAACTRLIEEHEINLAVYGVGYALPIVALAYFMEIRYEIRNRERARDSDQ